MKFKLHGMARILLSITGLCILLQSVQAQFVDTNRDLILTFRKIQPGDVGSIDLEIDIGQASKYYNAAPGSSFAIGEYTTNELASALPEEYTGFPGTMNNLGWSVIGCVSPFGDSGDPSIPTRTLWLTAPCPDVNTPATPWQRESIYQQGPTATKLETIRNNAQTWALANSADSVTNSPTAAAISTGNQYCDNPTLGSIGNFGTFQGSVENTTGGSFGYLSAPARSDLYELEPGSGAGTYLGYFELTTSGLLTFYAAQVTSFPAPTLSIANDHAGHVLISFQSTAGGIYTLHYTGAAGLTTPVSTWSTFGTTITGDGTVKSFQQNIGGSGTVTYYSVNVN
jgi:hypothetical protein